MGMGMGMVSGVELTGGRNGTSSPEPLGNDLRNMLSELCGASLLCVKPKMFQEVHISFASRQSGSEDSCVWIQRA